MKVCVVTIIDNINYGTYLQALALCKAVDKLGESVVLLNYCRVNQSRKFLVENRLKSANSLKMKILALIFQGVVSPIRREIFLHEINKLVPLTKKFVGFEAVKKNIPEADVYLLGSDQVWNTDYNNGIDHTFYLDFAGSNKRKIAYAASIGMNELDVNYKEEIKLLLHNFNSITLRERKSVSLLESIGFSNITSVLDPTFLLSKDEWNQLFKIKRVNIKNYVLIYSVEKDKTQYIVNLAKSLYPNKKLILVTNGNPLLNRFPNVYKTFFSPSIKTFLGLIENADFVVVSSFHGAAFSINYNKQFIVVRPNRYNVRIEDLLDSVSLENRMVSINTMDDISNISINDFIDYNIVNNKLEDLKSKSNNKLKEMLYK